MDLFITKHSSKYPIKIYINHQDKKRRKWLQKQIGVVFTPIVMLAIGWSSQSPDNLTKKRLISIYIYW